MKAEEYLKKEGIQNIKLKQVQHVKHGYITVNLSDIMEDFAREAFEAGQNRNHWENYHGTFDLPEPPEFKDWIKQETK